MLKFCHCHGIHSNSFLSSRGASSNCTCGNPKIATREYRPACAHPASLHPSRCYHSALFCNCQIGWKLRQIWQSRVCKLCQTSILIKTSDRHSDKMSFSEMPTQFQSKDCKEVPMTERKGRRQGKDASQLFHSKFWITTCVTCTSLL